MRDEGPYAVGREEEGGQPWPTSGPESQCRDLEIILARTYTGSRPWSVNRDGDDNDDDDDDAIVRLADLPNEVLFHILGFLDVSDLLATSRVSQPALCCLTTAVSPTVFLLAQGLRRPLWESVLPAISLLILFDILPGYCF